jgi:hypothetical protein
MGSKYSIGTGQYSHPKKLMQAQWHSNKKNRLPAFLLPALISGLFAIPLPSSTHSLPATFYLCCK